MENVKSLSLDGVKTMEEKKLVGFRVVGGDIADFQEEIPKASMELAKRKNEIKHLVEPVKLIGAFKASETSEDDDGYWSCFEVHDFEDIPEGMVTLTVPAQKYAVLNFTGRASEIYRVYDHLHLWIDENGHKRTPDKWTLEIYSKWSENEDIVDLCDPIL
ncbi:hypothetical protein A6P54_18975 [Bacillus sp. MKU004]|jgi:predicted transcriptional regulator YdeE|nr:hypothetical protein A6P54_18975 [Bacillus sp. MKU004]QTC42895.1 GyrI-like domain-containing protein [Bacillus sp. V3]